MVGVSGGVDSVALLHLLVQKGQSIGTSNQSTVQKRKKTGDWRLGTSDSMSRRLIVAHFNHGIRPDSAKDEEFVRQLAKKYGLPFESGRGHLGASASEETARVARYKFLNRVKEKHRAKSIITAHHQDDLIETALLNLLRGTGRRGLTALAQNPDVIRPLLNVPKIELLRYAKTNNLKWREDETNQDDKYLRNYIRKYLLPKLSKVKRQKLVLDLGKLTEVNSIINDEIAKLSQIIAKNGRINRSRFALLPSEIGSEVLMRELRRKGVRQFDKKAIERLSLAVKTAQPGTKHDVKGGLALQIGSDSVHFTTGD